MGAALDTPSKCPLCNELTRHPVVLRCKHSFCQRCIGDLWSIQPAGPFRCPVWKCNTCYQTLPFDSSKLWPLNSTRRLSSPSSSGLLGKRKASDPSTEQPIAKRPSASEGSAVIETPVISQPGKTELLPSVETTSNGLGSASDDARSSSDYRDALQRSSEQEDDSDCSVEVDMFGVPPLVTPRQDSRVPSASPDDLPSFTAASTSELSVSPGCNVKQSPVIPTHAADPSGSVSGISILTELKRRNSGPVPCHYCPKTVHQSAVRTCLVCGASMCADHLRPHVESPVFQSHTLVPPTEDISIWRCQEHQEINRIYCRDCTLCVCTVCTVIGAHRGHVCISIREAEQELRGNLKEEVKRLQKVEQQVKDRVTEFSQKEEAIKVVLSEVRASVSQQYATIREAFQQEEQSALRCVEEEESRVVGSLEQKLGHLHYSLRSIQNGLHTLETLVDAKGENVIRDQAFIMEYSKVTQLSRKTCAYPLDVPEEMNEARLKCLQRWTEKRLDVVVISESKKNRELYVVLYGTVPILDENTAHPKLQMSDNNRRVTYTEAQQAFINQEARFSSFPQVLAKHGLQGGRWYWEVEVPVDEGRWKVGICDARMERKGQRDSSHLGHNAFSWCLASDRKKLAALHNKAATPVTADGLRRVGIFLEYDEGVLTFFNATTGGSLAPMHYYKHTFTGCLYPAISVSKTQLAICSDLFEL
ncbi:tripartite motif-containing protein 14 [Corythoichthys intestinalis]|uniref:tripartite motif-containing protein 14 n=1 Tax=Corythoichthys intestinalis TaxID=161448 RepID=UPI0025A59B3D|nr:tripartite motif-containing protein 14 [Corythoichthys intestinalis]XP_061812918.1 tripartite motif-containing protein 14 [Nerophis lumbriciformis]